MIRPCVDEPDRYTVHGELGSEVDLGRLADELPENATCSPGLGVARLKIGEVEVTLYGDGDFDARGVRDMDEAERLVEELTDLVSL